MRISLIVDMCRIVFAMQQYRSEAEWELSRWARNYSQLSEEHKYALQTWLVFACVLAHSWLVPSIVLCVMVSSSKSALPECIVNGVPSNAHVKTNLP